MAEGAGRPGQGFAPDFGLAPLGGDQSAIGGFHPDQAIDGGAEGMLPVAGHPAGIFPQPAFAGVIERGLQTGLAGEAERMVSS